MNKGLWDERDTYGVDKNAHKMLVKNLNGKDYFGEVRGTQEGNIKPYD
jgi:hypothetical protein